MDGATTAGDTPERMLQLAQLEQVRLENEKLKLELAERKKGQPWYHRLTQMVPIITALGAIVGFLWGVVQYGAQQAKNRETAEREFMKPWLESQRAIYLQALASATVVANSDDPEKRHQATEEFWRLYQGHMILVETKRVSGAMVHFGHCLDGTDTCSRIEMNVRCRALATVMAESMAATAKMTFKEFVANQFRYSSGPEGVTSTIPRPTAQRAIESRGDLDARETSYRLGRPRSTSDTPSPPAC
jgi:hypothetical protein